MHISIAAQARTGVHPMGIRGSMRRKGTKSVICAKEQARGTAMGCYTYRAATLHVRQAKQAMTTHVRAARLNLPE